MRGQHFPEMAYFCPYETMVATFSFVKYLICQANPWMLGALINNADQCPETS